MLACSMLFLVRFVALTETTDKVTFVFVRIFKTLIEKNLTMYIDNLLYEMGGFYEKSNKYTTSLIFYKNALQFASFFDHKEVN